MLSECISIALSRRIRPSLRIGWKWKRRKGYIDEKEGSCKRKRKLLSCISSADENSLSLWLTLPPVECSFKGNKTILFIKFQVMINWKPFYREKRYFKASQTCCLGEYGTGCGAELSLYWAMGKKSKENTKMETRGWGGHEGKYRRKVLDI